MIQFKKAITGHDFIKMKVQFFYYFIVAKAFDFYKLNPIYENCVDGELSFQTIFISNIKFSGLFEKSIEENNPEAFYSLRLAKMKCETLLQMYIFAEIER